MIDCEPERCVSREYSEWSPVKSPEEASRRRAFVLLDHEALRLKDVFRKNIHSGVQQSPQETSRRRTFVLLSTSIKYSSNDSRRLNTDFDVLLPLGSLVMKKRIEGKDRHPGLMIGRREIRLEYILIWRLADLLSVKRETISKRRPANRVSNKYFLVVNK